MDSQRRGGSKRNSGNFEHHGQAVQRRTSKKTSSRDRHGHVYPDHITEQTIRAVTPEALPGIPSHHSPTSRSYVPPPANNVRPNPAPLPYGRSWENVPRSRTASHGSDDRSANEASVRSRTRTMEERSQGGSSPTLMLRSRQRIGSLQPVGSLALDEAAKTLSSIGFPSVLPSPPLPVEQPPKPQRLMRTKARTPRALSPTMGSNAQARVSAPPYTAPETTKILQLMKTTCGRMHGILSFRTAKTGKWSSGYCAINVASGSLIYQMKGEVSHAKTLIPDLRGCRVRTLYDAETQSTFLEVATRASDLSLHLRPGVPETFDSWLAALLCWQPIRPKGIQNKMTKPQTANISDRRVGDRKRHSQISIKEAKIIKVGKMLLWNKDNPLGSSASPINERASTYKQQRAMSKSWQRVSCTLLEDGNFTLYAEIDSSLLCTVPLSRLSRCAISRLDPSVLEDEFSLAIYPQYTTAPEALSQSKPVYLLLESRVLFEVWFVLLRAFTVPELYGPEHLNKETSLDQVGADKRAMGNAIDDMFRVERLFSLRIIEAKLHSSRRDRTLGQYRHQSAKSKDWILGNYFAEVRLDGELRAMTAIKSDTSNPFWREDFNFIDLPPVLSSASILVKARNSVQQDWKLISRGVYDLEQGDTVEGDIEILPLDQVYGKVDLRLDDLERAADVEQWWPVLNDKDEAVGEMLAKIRLEELTVLMSKDYKDLSELLHSFSNGLTHQIAQVVPAELRRLAEILLNIFQVSAQAGEWIMSLVEDEIDGVHKETPISRFRYSRRLASNDSSSVEREIFLRDLGKSATVEANLLFRGNSLLTKALDLHMRRLGKEYLEDTLSEMMRDIDESDPECEVDPNKVTNPHDLQRNWRNLIALTENVWKSILVSANRCPPELRMIFRHIRACAEDRYGNFLRSVTYSSVSGFLFLRFFCPAVLNPKLFGLLGEHPRPRAQRTLTLMAKALQTLANLTTFGNKEPWMEPMNAFLTSHRQEFKDFVDAICAISSDRTTSAIPPSYATPITILRRLPDTSRQGFPSLPYLIDQARECAALVHLWLDTRYETTPASMSQELQTFDALCEASRQKTRTCLAQAEQAERPSGVLELKWAELVEQMGRKARLRADTRSLASTPRANTPATQNISTASVDKGYFHPSAVPKHATAIICEDEDASPEIPTESTSPRSTSSAWDTASHHTHDVQDTRRTHTPNPGVWDPGVIPPPDDSATQRRRKLIGSSLYALDTAGARGDAGNESGWRSPGEEVGSPRDGRTKLAEGVEWFRRKVRE